MENTAANNIVGLHNGSVHGDIRTFLDSFESKYTTRNYERSLKNFFMWYKNKSVNELVKEDLHVRNADMLRYRKFLKDHPADYTNNYINSIIAAIQSLYEFLERNEYDLKASHVKLKPLPDDSVRCGSLYANEAEEMSQRVLCTTKGQEKSALIRLAYTTSLRKSTLLSITKDDIVLHPSGNYYELTAIGKGGEKHTVPISHEMYRELVKITEQEYYAQYNDGKFFHLDKMTIQNMMNKLKDEMNIPTERNIVFHSFRNVAAMFGTLEEAKTHYNHSSIVVTDKYYRHYSDDQSNAISLRIEDKIEDQIFEELSKEELIKLIESQNQGLLFQMKREARDIITNRPVESVF
ncbi:site-specific integrase [Paenibacillus sp. Marseille-Q4541]|uniref:tyrosine-type recombinase/integrase n=1 Tax=Paenibacillus sp. Marseille-Q4541 TaxID=2831522 RepID=UPI001BA58409|nr:site-specific integrase [Paenibacillus sp. Marseille-Q4541]